MYGPQAAFIAELFGTRVRYSGASMGYQVAGIFGGALAPIIATALLAWSGSWVAVSLYVVGALASRWWLCWWRGRRRAWTSTSGRRAGGSFASGSASERQLRLGRAAGISAAPVVRVDFASVYRDVDRTVCVDLTSVCDVKSTRIRGQPARRKSSPPYPAAVDVARRQ